MNDEHESRMRGSSDPTVAATVLSYLVRIPGMRPRAPKRNVITALVYLYAVAVVVWLLLRFL